MTRPFWIRLHSPKIVNAGATDLRGKFPFVSRPWALLNL